VSFKKRRSNHRRGGRSAFIDPDQLGFLEDMVLRRLPHRFGTLLRAHIEMLDIERG
jgi:hypothetical protein